MNELPLLWRHMRQDLDPLVRRDELCKRFLDSGKELGIGPGKGHDLITIHCRIPVSPVRIWVNSKGLSQLGIPLRDAAFARTLGWGHRIS